jgi:hypothetical protein
LDKKKVQAEPIKKFCGIVERKIKCRLHRMLPNV